jgi:hypothetical protein
MKRKLPQDRKSLGKILLYLPFIRGDFAAKTSLAVSSIEFLFCSFDERDIGIRLGGGGGHRAMIPPPQIFFFPGFFPPLSLSD